MVSEWLQWRFQTRTTNNTADRAVVCESCHLFYNTRKDIDKNLPVASSFSCQLTFGELQLQLRQLLPDLRRQGHTDSRRGLQHHRQQPAWGSLSHGAPVRTAETGPQSRRWGGNTTSGLKKNIYKINKTKPSLVDFDLGGRAGCWCFSRLAATSHRCVRNASRRHDMASCGASRHTWPCVCMQRGRTGRPAGVSVPAVRP